MKREDVVSLPPSVPVLPSDSMCSFHCAGDFLTMSIAQQAAAWSESPHHAEVLVVLGGRLLIDWLLKTAARDESSPEQGQAEQALLRLLQSGKVARPADFG